MLGSKISPWMGEPDPVKKQVLAKMAEELSECAARVARCQAAGINDIDPDTGRTNKEELEREMADVVATFKLSDIEIDTNINIERITTKLNGFNRWMVIIRERLNINKEQT